MTLRRKWAGLAPRERRTVRLGAFLLLPALAYSLLLRPVVSGFARLESRVAQERDLYRRERQLLRAHGAREQDYGRKSAALLEQSPRLFDGRDTVTAAAELASYVTGQAAGHRVFVQSSETGASDLGEDGILRMKVEVRGVSDIAGLLAWLGALEGGRKLLRVTQLSVLPAAELGASSGPGSGELLGLTLTVEGYALFEPGTVSAQAKAGGP